MTGTRHDEDDSALRLAEQPIEQVMSTPPYCIGTSTTLGQALAGMAQGRLRHLVVNDESGRCVGVLADRSIAAEWAAQPGTLTHRRVSAVLDPTPAVVGVGANVVHAARLMRSIGVDAVAVVDARGVAVGIVTCSDLVAFLAR